MITFPTQDYKLSKTATQPTQVTRMITSSSSKPQHRIQIMTQHATNGLTKLTQSKTNVRARWSRTLALGLEMHNSSTLGLWGPPMTSLPSRQIFGRIDIHANIYK